MVVESIEYICKNCNKELKEDEIPCMNCNSSSRKISIVIKETLVISDFISRARTKNPNISGHTYEITNKMKTSGETQLPTKETMIIDRTSNDITIKHHIVMEKEGDDWITKHDEIVEFNAKIRQKKNQQNEG